MTDVALASAITQEALYFGVWDEAGHFLHRVGGRKIYWPSRDLPNFPWTEGLMDCGLLKNGKHPDKVDGKVFWTCGGRDIEHLWRAFYWWDRSGDKRGNSCSGFYTCGFPGPGAQRDAFAFACQQFPHIVARQAKPLELQP